MTLIAPAGRWTKVDPEKEQHLGHIYERMGQRAHEKKCDYCGKWMTYDIKNIAAWLDNVKLGLNGWPEKVHCGSEHCQDYHNRVLVHEEKIKADARRIGEKMFFQMKKQGIIA